MESTVPMTQEQNTMPLVHERLWGELAAGSSGSVLGELSDSHVVNVRVETKLRFWDGIFSRPNMTASRLRVRIPYTHRVESA